ncbi:hypothetical protein Zmor_002830 [Zophobas morio]|uniref:Uncharacterized protein n=1 Tax=Zophobas morio TaxID=2755281 RepID=A0AA38M0N1_9CUCU|nr:hypothetical protein Zmor_002830 [Zophobas morio]
MLVLVLATILLAEGILGNPNTFDVSREGKTFDTFRESSWNPVNWFGQDSSEDKSEKQLMALYNTIECLTKKEPKECVKLVDDAKIYFEKDENKKKNKKPMAANNSTSQ